jgi:hypothetical protein
MNKTGTTTSKAKSQAPKDGFLEMIKKILGSAPKKTTAPGKLSGRLSLPLLPPMAAPKKKTTVVQVKKTVSGKPSLLPSMDMAPKTPKKKTTVVQVKKTVSGKPSLLPSMDMAPMAAPKKKMAQVVKVEEKTVSGKPDSKKTTKVKQVVEKKVMKSSGADKPKMKGGCSSMYKGKGAGCTKGKIGGNFGYFF